MENQPVGDPLPQWRPALRPPSTPMEGRFCRLEPLTIDAHAESLYAAFGEDSEDRIWTYMAYGPFKTLEAFRNWMAATCLGDDPMFYAIIDNKSGRALGVASYLRIDPAIGVIEVGYITYAPRLQKTPAATEAMFLMMRRVFAELGYRRYEWKCDALNEKSMSAAERLGFRFEGIFRQATIYKNRNRDTAWFSIIDSEWQALEAAFVAWLSENNIGNDGAQKKSLRQCMPPHSDGDKGPS